ncbi:hypothetical protein ILYODFUR_004532 [Ilyodon furcidens]|uniref:Uncharacterized protein n=1 Tax=Ilyodon furcidens TaxID=33524 RepID=A0ABV0TJY7_9TELE
MSLRRFGLRRREVNSHVNLQMRRRALPPLAVDPTSLAGRETEKQDGLGCPQRDESHIPASSLEVHLNPAGAEPVFACLPLTGQLFLVSPVFDVWQRAGPCNGHRCQGQPWARSHDLNEVKRAGSRLEVAR